MKIKINTKIILENIGRLYASNYIPDEDKQEYMSDELVYDKDLTKTEKEIHKNALAAIDKQDYLNHKSGYTLTKSTLGGGLIGGVVGGSVGYLAGDEPGAAAGAGLLGSLGAGLGYIDKRGNHLAAKELFKNEKDYENYKQQLNKRITTEINTDKNEELQNLIEMKKRGEISEKEFQKELKILEKEYNTAKEEYPIFLKRNARGLSY